MMTLKCIVTLFLCACFSALVAQDTHPQLYTETAFEMEMTFVWVEGGTFQMGATSEQGSVVESDEKPVRNITLDGFYMAQFEVTQGQWEQVMGTTMQKHYLTYAYAGLSPEYPMYYVSREDAMAFCKRLSEQTGKYFTLPTEAQWEYAARGGNKHEKAKYAGGNTLSEVAWYSANSNNATHLYGMKKANALGLYDMSGSVWEWCKDYYGKYDVNDTINPQGPVSGTNGVFRGGSWSSSENYCRVSFRSYDLPTMQYDNLGFRVVMIP